LRRGLRGALEKSSANFFLDRGSAVEKKATPPRGQRWLKKKEGTNAKNFSFSGARKINKKPFCERIFFTGQRVVSAQRLIKCLGLGPARKMAKK